MVWCIATYFFFSASAAMKLSIAPNIRLIIARWWKW